GEDAAVVDDARIRAAPPTLQHLLGRSAACAVMTHLGRPGGKPEPALSLKPVVERLSQVLPDHRTRHCDEVAGPRANEITEALAGGEA
ncbi:MAG: phosphoglycerate kinase, partial [Gammaproteobacteria bacterium]|nr:phosphoglycerate kinase [Gammaproteobacteria bacterium]NIR60834.1 phosphoglycerate kinase [Gammaproteobacteria bacterium]